MCCPGQFVRPTFPSPTAVWRIRWPMPGFAASVCERGGCGRAAGAVPARRLLAGRSRPAPCQPPAGGPVRSGVRAAGDRASLLLLPGFGHFELIDPLSAAWPTVVTAFHAAAERLTEHT